MSTPSKLLSAAVVITVGIVAFAAIGGALAAMVLLLALAWILSRLLHERGAVAPRGLWWKLIATGVTIFTLAFAFFAGPWPQSWRDRMPGDVAWNGGFFVFAIAVVCVAVGLLSGITLLITTRRRVTR